MFIERERRWLVDPTQVPGDILNIAGIHIQQGYLTRPSTKPVVRGRLLRHEGALDAHMALQTIKAPNPAGDGMAEVEFEMPLAVGHQFMSLCLATLAKLRKCSPIALGAADTGKIELDLFKGPVLDGRLVIAEIEVPSYDVELQVPSWFGPEITHGVSGLSNVEIAFAPDIAVAMADAIWAEYRAAK